MWRSPGKRADIDRASIKQWTHNDAGRQISSSPAEQKGDCQHGGTVEILQRSDFDRRLSPR